MHARTALILLPLAAAAAAQSPAAPEAGAQPAGAVAGKAAKKVLGVVTLQLDGLDGDARSAALAALDIARYQERTTIGSARLQRLLAEAPDEIREALQVFGYYEARARIERSDLPDGRHRVHIVVERGEPVRVVDLAAVVDGPGGAEVAIQRRLAVFLPGRGAVLDHRVYESSKAGVVRALQRRGYFDATLEEHRVEVRAAARTASVKLRWQSGPRYRFGVVQFEGAQFPDDFLRRFVPWKAGEPYDQDQIEALQQGLAAAGYFGSIEIEPQLEQRADAAIPIRIALAPAARSAWTIGTYYESNYGAGVRVGLDRRWINARGHIARGDIEAAQALQSLTTEYRIPHPQIAGAQWLLGLGLRSESTDSVDNRSGLLRAGLVGNWQEWTGVASLNALRGSFRVGSRRVTPERRDATVVYPELSLSRVYARDRIRPKVGGSLRFTARAASANLGSDLDLLQLRVEGRYVRPAGEGARLLGRAELGWTETNDFAALPPDLRFFAGGGGSVRGYAWQDLGPRDAAGDPVGGRNVATFSLEYERSFRSDWSWAAFVDGGNVFNGTRVQPVFGIGGGLRWSSPIGPIRIDLAHGLDNDDHALQLHFSAGPDL
jgi:translocation and assembly module TamA